MVNESIAEKIWVVGYYQVRRHSRVLYIPLEQMVCDIHDIRKGDTLKVMLVKLIKSSRDEEEISG